MDSLRCKKCGKIAWYECQHCHTIFCNNCEVHICEETKDKTNMLTEYEIPKDDVNVREFNIIGRGKVLSFTTPECIGEHEHPHKELNTIDVNTILVHNSIKYKVLEVERTILLTDPVQCGHTLCCIVEELCHKK